MRVIFMGTPDFAVPTLQSILDSEHEVIGVVTQPDRPKGRGNKVQYSKVKEKALEYQIPIFQPLKVKEEGFFKTMEELTPDAIVVVAFGQILPKSILELPRYGCINVHASLLPKLRGAAPIQWAIVEGEKVTGVTTMFMDVGLDTGDILMQKAVSIEPEETGGSLHDKLSALGGKLMIETLDGLLNETLIRKKQETEHFTYAKILTKEMGKIDFSKDAEAIERMIRGFNPWPGGYTFLNKKTLKIWKARVIEKDYAGNTGDIVEVTKDCIVVKTGKGSLGIEKLQLEGKKTMETEAFLRGFSVSVGTTLD